MTHMVTSPRRLAALNAETAPVAAVGGPEIVNL